MPLQYDKAKTEKEKIELNALKLNRDLEKVQMELNELREIRGLEDVRGAKEKQVSYFGSKKVKISMTSTILMIQDERFLISANPFHA